MHVPRLLPFLLVRPDVEVVEPRLPEGLPRRKLREDSRLSRILFLNLGSRALAVRCFRTCITVDGVPTSSSLSKR